MVAISGVLTVCLVILGFPGVKHQDESAYYATSTVKGSVTILNHPKLGKTAASGTYIVFQRTNCKKCVIGTRTDADGRYELHIGAGRYRLIIREGTREGQTRDILAPNQQRLVDVGPVGTVKTFDVAILLPD